MKKADKVAALTRYILVNRNTRSAIHNTKETHKERGTDV